MILKNLYLSMSSFLRIFQSDSFNVSVTARRLAIASDWHVSINKHRPQGSRNPCFRFGDLWWALKLGENHLWVDWKFKLSVILKLCYSKGLSECMLEVHVLYCICNIHYISCNFQIIHAQKSVIIYLRFILSNVCFSELHISPEMLLKITSCESKIN